MSFHPNRLLFYPSRHISAVIFCCILTLSACDREKDKTTPPPTAEPKSQPKAEAEQAAKVLQRGMYADFALKLNELKNNEQAALLADLFEGLVIFDMQGEAIPGAAEKWQTTDNKLWTFTLRPNLYWSNGEPMLAEDFVRSWQKLAQSDHPLRQYLAYLNVENAEAVLARKLPVEQLGVRAIDNMNLQIRVNQPMPYLPQMLAHSALLPQRYYIGAGAEWVGNGAYRVLKQQENTVELEKNPFYRNQESIYFQKVNYRKILPSDTLDSLDWVDRPAQKNPSLLYFPQLCTYFYEFNFNDPQLKQSAVRSALISMISARDIVQNDPTMRANSVNFLPQNMQFEQEREWRPTLVEQLLGQAGISHQKPLTLRVTYEDSGIHPSIADRLIRAWSQSDLIRIQAEPLPHKTLLEKRAQGDFQLIRSGWCADYNDPSAFLNLLYSQNPDNKTGFKRDNIDKLLEQSLSVNISAAERSALYQQIISAAQEEKVVLPLFQYMKPVYVHQSLAGYDLKNPTEKVYSKDLYRKTDELNAESKSTDTGR